MLKHIHIRNFALIDTLDIPFDKGLSVLTGETGSGKSIILGALGLVLGNRADVKSLKSNKSKCVVEVSFKLNSNAVKAFCENNDIDFFEETLLRREISESGRSRAFINDSPVLLEKLQQLGALLVDIHSQHANLVLNNSNFQTSILDIQAKQQKEVEAFALLFETYKKNKIKLNALKNAELEMRQQQDFLSFQYNELVEANIVEDEEVELKQELDLLNNAESIKEQLTGAIAAIDNNELSIVANLKQATSLAQTASKHMPKLGDVSDRLKSSAIEIADILSELEIQNDSIEYDESRLSFVSERLDVLYALQHKHGVNSNAELFVKKQNLLAEMQVGDSIQSEIDVMELEQKKAIAHLNSIANSITEKRKEAKPIVEQFVAESLLKLGMPHGAINIEITDTSELNALGKNSVSILFKANTGSDFQPLTKVASGGELSRLMLSLKALMAGSSGMQTLIFDEIDTGVSGDIAAKMGSLMQKMANKMQIITISHLPQVASKANHHYKVFKEIKGNQTFTKLVRLNENDRIDELAQMLSSEKTSDAAIENAKVLLGLK